MRCARLRPRSTTSSRQARSVVPPRSTPSRSPRSRTSVVATEPCWASVSPPVPPASWPLRRPRPSPAADVDIMALQTAASLENLAVITYKTALTLPYLKGDSACAQDGRRLRDHHDEAAQGARARRSTPASRLSVARSRPRPQPEVHAGRHRHDPRPQEGWPARRRRARHHPRGRRHLDVRPEHPGRHRPAGPPAVRHRRRCRVPAPRDPVRRAGPAEGWRRRPHHRQGHRWRDQRRQAPRCRRQRGLPGDVQEDRPRQPGR